jgi:ABC-type cobalamin/Fe3+-siderophores transport system ATPase subunit
MAGESKKRRISVRKWFKCWLSASWATYDYSSNTVSMGGRTIPRPLLMAKLISDSAKWGAHHCPKHVLEAEVTVWLAEQATASVSRAQSKVAHRENPDRTELHKWVKAVTGGEGALAIAVMEQFLWQVKRKLYALPVIEHLMPVIVGPQGSGKSTAIKKLLEALAYLVDYAGLDVLNDSRETFRLARFYVTFLDEMEGASRAEIEKVKNRITADHVSWRNLGFNTVEMARQTTTFIGASNRGVAELLSDPTGMRRFAEIRSLPKMDWPTLNALDTLAIWRSVKEGGEAPTLAVLPQLRAHQQELRASRPIEMFLAEHTLPSSSPCTRFSEIREMYAKWCKDRGYFIESDGPLGTALKAHVGEAGWRKSDGKMKYALRLIARLEPVSKAWADQA